MTNRILFVIGCLVAVIFFLTGRNYAGMFGCSSMVADMVATGFRIYAVTCVVMGYDVINSMYFTSCGDAKSSAIISWLRGMLRGLGVRMDLPEICGMKGVRMTATCT